MKNYTPFIILLVFFLIMGISYYFGRKQRILRELKKSKIIPINRARQNEYVKIVGKAIGGSQPLKAPLSGRKCLHYYILIEKKGDKSWHTYIEEEHGQDFFLEAGSERAIVKSSRIHFNLKRTLLVFDHKDKSGWLNDAKPHLETFLRKYGKESTGLLGFNKTLRFSEGIIEEGETIAVKGIAQWKTLTEPIEGYSYSKLLTLTGNEKQKLIITDEPEATQKEARS